MRVISLARTSAVTLLFMTQAFDVAAQDDGAPVDLTDAMTLAAAWLDAEQDYKDLPGVAAAIVRDQETVWSAALGHADVEAGVPLSTDTRFHIASISKTFAAVAIMPLVEQGKIRLDDPVEEVVPWFRPPQLDWDNAPITVRGLLTHSSGLNSELASPYWYDIPSVPSGAEMQAALAEAPPLYSASTVFEYSNLAYLLLGEIVAHVSGVPYVDYLQKSVLDPLGLEATVASYPASEYGTSHAVRYGPANRDRRYPRLGPTDSEKIAAMGGLSSTVLDLGRYASWQLRLHDRTAPAEVLRPSTLRTMHRVHFTDTDWGTTWGLGFVVSRSTDGETLVGHSGHFPGHKSQLLIDPGAKMAYVVMASTDGVDPKSYADALRSLVEKLDGIPEDAEHRLDRSQLAEYAGRYDSGWEELYIGPWEGRLAVVSLPSDDPAESMRLYEHVDGDVFRRVREDGEFGETLTFDRDSDGSVTGGRYYNYEISRTRAPQRSLRLTNLKRSANGRP